MELGFGSLRGQLASLVAEKAQEAAKRKEAELECARESAKRVRLEKDQAALLTDAEQRMESAHAELRALRSAYEQLRSDHEQESHRREIAEEQLKSLSESAKKLAAELALSQAATRTIAAKLSQAEVQSSGFAHAERSFEQNYTTVQQQIAQIRSESEKHTEHLKELQQTNSSLADALRQSDAELSGYRNRDDAAAKAIERAVEEKEAAQQKNSLAEAEILRLKRALELEIEATQRSVLTVQLVESERASMLHMIAEYERIHALENLCAQSQSESAEPSNVDDSRGSEGPDKDAVQRVCDNVNTAEATVVADSTEPSSIDDSRYSEGPDKDAVQCVCDNANTAEGTVVNHEDSRTSTCEIEEDGAASEPESEDKDNCTAAPAKHPPQQMQLPVVESEG